MSRLEVNFPGFFDMLPLDCANHALTVFGPRPFYMGKTGGQGAKFDEHCDRIVEEQLNVCEPSVVETAKLNS